MEEKTILSVLSHDKNIKIYRPEFRKICGSVNAAILLHQMMYWGLDENGEAIEFYKFKEPCKHEAYKPGDSWCEELGFSREEFDNAINQIGFKKIRGWKEGRSKVKQVAQKETDAFVIYYTDKARFTWYRVNVALLGKALKSLYLTLHETTSKITLFNSKVTTTNKTVKESTQTLKSKRTPESKNLIKNNEDSQTSESPQTSESSQTLDNHPLYQLIGKRHSRQAKKGKWSANRKPSRGQSKGDQPEGDQFEEEIKVQESHGLKPLTYPELYNIAWRLKVPMKAVERIYDQLLFSVENGNPYKVTDIKQRLGMWVANELRKGELVKVTEPGYELDLVVLRDDDSPVGRFKSIIRQFFMALSEMTPEEKSGQEFEELKKKVVKLKHKYFPDGKTPQEIKDYLKKFI